MIVPRVLPFAKSLIMSHVQEDSVVIDGTCGNGYDTEFLAQCVPKGHVYACDIQPQAIENTRQRVSSYSNVSVIHTGNELITEHMETSHQHKISAALFNLGYLPKGDKTIVTHATTTIKAFESIFKQLRPEGIIVFAIYPGHPEGFEESKHLNAYFEQLDQTIAHVIKYEFINQQNHPPYIIGIEKRK